MTPTTGFVVQVHIWHKLSLLKTSSFNFRLADFTFYVTKGQLFSHFALFTLAVTLDIGLILFLFKWPGFWSVTLVDQIYADSLEFHNAILFLRIIHL